MQKTKIVVFGVGEIWRKYKDKLADEYEITGLIDSTVRAGEQIEKDGYIVLMASLAAFDKIAETHESYPFGTYGKGG